MVYVLYQRKETRLLHLRAFLLCSMFAAIILPFSKFSIDIPDYLRVDDKFIASYKSLFEQGITTEITKAKTEAFQVNENNQTNETNPRSDNYGPYYSDAKHNTNVSNKFASSGFFEKKHHLNLLTVLTVLYLIGFAFILLRMLFSLAVIFRLYFVSAKKRMDGFKLLIKYSVKAPFSFFKWVFISQKMFTEDNYREIILHEKVHVSQYHSIDIIVIELLSAVMWFNPFVWKMRNSVQLVHEYLADEGVLNTGIDRLQYQALLVNQVAEERLICLSSGFHQSQIKKRLIMMTKNKTDQNPKLRILYLLPIVLLLFIGVAYVNGQKKAIVENVTKSVAKNHSISKPEVVNTKEESKFASWFTEKCYNGIVKNDICFIVAEDKVIRTKEEYFSINPLDIDTIYLFKAEDSLGLKARIKEHYKEYASIAEKSLAMLLVYKKDM